jgi:hypothetical protein
MNLLPTSGSILRSFAVRSTALLALAMPLPAACADEPADAHGSGGAGQDSGSGGSVDWDNYCDTRASLTCPDFDVDACKQQQACFRSSIREEGQGLLVTCLQEECEWSLEGGCMALLADVPVSGAGQTFFDACGKRVSDCMISDDACYSHTVFSDEKLAELAACFDAPACADAELCINEYFDTLFATCWAWAG